MAPVVGSPGNQLSGLLFPMNWSQITGIARAGERKRNSRSSPPCRLSLIIKDVFGLALFAQN